MKRTVLIGGLALWGLLLTPFGSLAAHSLWRVESPEGMLFLQGSVHLLKEEHYPLPEVLENAFLEADCLVLEVDLNEMGNQEQQRRIAQMTVLPHGDSLKHVLGQSLYNRVSQILPSLKVPRGYFDQFKPWFVAMSLTRIRLAQLGYNPALGVDAYFYNRASNMGKPVYGLETLVEQLRLLDNLPTPVQREMVQQTLAELSTIESDVDSIVTAWRTGDMEAIESRQLTKFRRYPQVYDALIRQRNLAWLGQIRDHLASGKTCLVVVGAAHLAGPDGLVASLKQAGYTLTQH